MFGFGKKRREAAAQDKARRVKEMRAEREGLETELELLTRKLNVSLQDKPSDRTTTLSRYPRRIVELKILIDEIDRKLRGLEA